MEVLTSSLLVSNFPFTAALVALAGEPGSDPLSLSDMLALLPF